MNGAKAAERPLDDDAAALEDDTLRHKEPFFELLSPPSARRTAVLGFIGAVAFFGIWEAGHYVTPESGQRFLPAVEQVLERLRYLFAEKDFLGDVLISHAHLRQLFRGLRGCRSARHCHGLFRQF